MTKKKKTPKKELKIGKTPNPKFDRIYQLILSAQTEEERIKWEAVLRRLESLS